MSGIVANLTVSSVQFSHRVLKTLHSWGVGRCQAYRKGEDIAMPSRILKAGGNQKEKKLHLVKCAGKAQLHLGWDVV